MILVEYVAYQGIVTCIQEFLVCQPNELIDIISFYNHIMIDKKRNKGDQSFQYNPKQWNKRGTFDIHNDISENHTLFQFI